MEYVLAVLKFLGALLLLGLGTERGTQLVKELLRAIGEKWPWFDFKNRKSFILAAVVAFLVSYYFHIDLVSWLKILDGYDASLVQLVSSLLIMLVSNVMHDKLFKVGELPPPAG